MAALIVIAMIVGFFVLRGRIMARFTDSVTHRNRSQLGRYLMLLIGLFFLFLFWLAASVRS